MPKPKRKRPTPSLRSMLLASNAHRCCVCKNSGINLHLHHIDGNRANTVAENLAVLCVAHHDVHHNPDSYVRPNHSELSTAALQRFKTSWEAFVAEARKPFPSVLATLSVFGTGTLFHSAKLVMQWKNGQIEYERIYDPHLGDMDYITDLLLEEVSSLGKNVKLVLLSEPVSFAYCVHSNSHGSLSNTVNEDFAIRLTDPVWREKSICSIYVNPHTPSLAYLFSIDETVIHEASIHLCQGRFLHVSTGSRDEQIIVQHKPSVRAQVTRLMRKTIKHWEPAHIFIGTGPDADPTALDELVLPVIWEREALTGRSSGNRR